MFLFGFVCCFVCLCCLFVMFVCCWVFLGGFGMGIFCCQLVFVLFLVIFYFRRSPWIIQQQ